MNDEPDADTPFDGDDDEVDLSFCAYLNPETGEPCLEEADWIIVWNSNEEDVDPSCQNHLSEMLSVSSEYIVYPANKTIHALEADVQEELEENEESVMSEMVAEEGGPSLRHMQRGDFITCPRRLEITGGHSDKGQDHWQHRQGEHFERCTFCGGVRPEDVIGLLRTGWTCKETPEKAFLFRLIPEGGDAHYHTGQVLKVYRQHFGADHKLFSEFLHHAFGGTWKLINERWVKIDS